MSLQSVRVERFKRINDASFQVPDLAVLVGGNNSGKSSLVQALHFGIALLQTIEASEGRWPKSGSYSTSLNPSDIIYSPSEDVYALGPGSRLTSVKEQATRITFTLSNGSICSVTYSKGRNRNIAVEVSDSKAARALASLDMPFSVFSPGLAGISKKESYVSDGVLFRALARGDANLVLRNILFRLWPGEAEDAEKTVRWEDFIADLREIFPKLNLWVEFNEAVDEQISVFLTTDGIVKVPLEIAGTGVLQAIQILSYIHRFQPSLMVLDEPDSHLHPDNQRLLCSLLKSVTSRGTTQVLLTTHSRHVLDAIGQNSGVLWVREGGVSIAEPDDEVGILLDIGGLDARERLGQPSTAAVILTEDEKKEGLIALVESSGFPMSETLVQAYYGATSPHNLRPLVQLIRQGNPNAVIVVHRDRDFLTDDEVNDWRSKVTKMNVIPFITDGRDIESYFLNIDYLHEQNPKLSKQLLNEALKSVIKDSQKETIASYVNGRIDQARRDKTAGTLDPGQLAIEAHENVTDTPQKFIGKPTLRKLRERIKIETKVSLNSGKASALLSVEGLKLATLKLKKPKSS